MKRLLNCALVFCFFMSLGSNAQVLRCKGGNGKVLFSDRPVICDGQSDIIPDKSSYVSYSDQIAARQRTERMQGELAEKEYEKESAIASFQADQQRQKHELERKASADRVEKNDADAVALCIRDVERRGASQDTKAELIAACRTSGINQRATGSSSEEASNCVKNVERSGASEKVKARQIAICHGGDVSPEPIPVVSAPPPPRPPAVVGGCFNGKCSDQYGQSYKRDVVGNIVRSDGRRCRQFGRTLECN